MNGWLIAAIVMGMVIVLLAGAGMLATLQAAAMLHRRRGGGHGGERCAQRDSGSGPVPAAGPEPAPEAGYERPWLQRAPAPEADQSWRGNGDWEQPELLTAPPAGDWRHPQWRDMPAARIPGYLG